MNGKTVRTPALLPVINPISPGDPARDAGDGVEALITNAYIFRRSTEFCGEHSLRGSTVLDFDGIIGPIPDRFSSRSTVRLR